ncbi:MAG: PilZ domain-containing protein [Sphingomonadales bacterium]|nr:PilZ domain-containing protein [Sphingomonadales bacterium]
MSSDDHTAGRRNDRLDVMWGGTLEVNDLKHDCKIGNVSTAGTLVATDAPVQLGDEVMLSIPNLGDFAGVVAWVGDGSFGLSLLAGPDLFLKDVAEEGGGQPIDRHAHQHSKKT